MGTLVTIQVTSCGDEAAEALDRAFRWFYEVESRCTRFDPESELMQLIGQGGRGSVGQRDPVRSTAIRVDGSGGKRRRI